MTAEDPDKPTPPRKPYEPPQISRVALRPDEAVLGSCKTMSVAGPIGASCGTMADGCFSIGS